MLRALAASVFVNTVVPFARSLGGLVRAGYLGKQMRRPIGPLYGVAFMDQVGYSTMSMILGALTLPMTMWTGNMDSRRAMLAVLGVCAVVLAFLAIRWMRDPILRWARRRAPAAAGGVEGVIEGAKRVLSRPLSYPVMVAGGAGVWTVNVLCIWCAGISLGADIGLPAAAAAWSLGSIAGVASGTPGGVGTTESAAIMPMMAMGIPLEDALTTMLLARSLQYASGILLGGVCLLSLSGPDPAPGEND